eukprot:g58266.t1
MGDALLGEGPESSVQSELEADGLQHGLEAEGNVGDDERQRSVMLRAVVAFWLLGLLNNASFVIMAAGAKQILDGGVGVVYLSNIMPGLIMKGSATFWS